MKLLQTFAVVLAAALLSGCAVFAKPETPAAAAGKKTEPQIVGKALLEAFCKNDAKKFLQELTPEIKQEFGSRDFELTRDSMVKKLGTPVSYSYLRNMEHPVAIVSIWVIRFEKQSADKKKTLSMETLFKAVYGKVDGKLQLLAFNFL